MIADIRGSTLEDDPGPTTTMVYGVRTSDPLTHAAACAVLFAATIAACAVPARRASQLDPVEALRSE